MTFNDLPPITPELAGWLVALIILFLWAFAAFRRWVAQYLYRQQLRERQIRAQKGELDSARLLKTEGFTIVDSQVHLLWNVYVDDEPVEIRLVADHIVERDGWRYVAEVKTGDSAPSIRNAATRRQLLEYSIAFDCDGILLIDMEEGRIHEIHFEEP